jgi:hypothetical protein
LFVAFNWCLNFKANLNSNLWKNRENRKKWKSIPTVGPKLAHLGPTTPLLPCAACSLTRVADGWNPLLSLTLHPLSAALFPLLLSQTIRAHPSNRSRSVSLARGPVVWSFSLLSLLRAPLDLRRAHGYRTRRGSRRSCGLRSRGTSSLRLYIGLPPLPLYRIGSTITQGNRSRERESLSPWWLSAFTIVADSLSGQGD